MKKWVVKETYKEGQDLVALLLKNRGIDEKDKEEFLNPPLLTEYIRKMPLAFKAALKKARELIQEAVEKGEPIIIHGDYDADGICGTAILYKSITGALKYDRTACFIPNRFDQGYGLSAESVHEIIKLVGDRFRTKGGLIITVDCGITVQDAVVDTIKEMGFKLIITDHHQRKEQDPSADVVLWNDTVVGATVSWMLGMVLGLHDEKMVSLAGIATVTDLIPLKGLNRALVKRSLEILNKNPPLGIKALLDVSGRRSGDISVYDLGYVIGPRLNATGRLQSALASLKLLLEDDPAEVALIAQQLNEVNSGRQDMTQKMFAMADIYSQARISENIIIVSSVEFHEGVIGLVAGKLSQKYYRPSIALSINGEIAKGSARSVSGVNIIEMLRKFEDRFLGLGGHPMAAGFSINTDRLDSFISEFTEHARQVISSDLLVPVLNVDLEIPLEKISPDLIREMDVLKPYGMGNPEPLFMSGNVGIAGADFVGRVGTHLSLKLFDGQKLYKAIMFDAKNHGVAGFDLGTRIDIVYSAALKEFNGKTSVDLVVKDWRPGKSDSD